MSDTTLVTKGELATILGITRKTLDTWVIKFGDALPVVERGGAGKEWQFDPRAVIAFLRERKSEEEARKAERGDQLSQLVLPMPAERKRQAEGNISLDDRLKAERLNALRIANAVRAKELVPAAALREAMMTTLAMLRRNLDNTARQIARDHGLPGPIATAIERRLEAMQVATVAEIEALFTAPADDASPALEMLLPETA